MLARQQLRCADRVAAEERCPRLLCELRRGACAPYRQRRRLRKSREIGNHVAQPLGRGGCDDDTVGLELSRLLHEGRERRVLAEVGDTPAAVAQGEAECDQPEVVLFLRRAGEQRVWPWPLAPAAPDAQEPAAEEVTGEMLLRDGDLAA